MTAYARAIGSKLRFRSSRLPKSWLASTTDLIFAAGGGIIAHPGGIAAGVRSLRQAWEAAVGGIPLADYAQNHPELAQALQKFRA